jgi:hypothetical protein
VPRLTRRPGEAVVVPRAPAFSERVEAVAIATLSRCESRCLV